MLLRGSFAMAAVWAISTLSSAAEKALVVDPSQSRVEVVVKATLDSFTGKLSLFEPTMTVGEDGQVTSARMAFRFRDVLTGKEGRDKEMHAWQDTGKFPDGVFVLTSLEVNPTPASGMVAAGRLTLHGVTRDLQFPASVIRDGDAYAVAGDAAIDTREFGLPVIRLMGLLKVDPMVHVRFYLQGRVAR